MHYDDKSLSEVHSTVKIKQHSSFIKRLLTFTGPAFMVSVGYMDPGNWATDIAGGSKFGYQLIWVILMANVMAILFQTLSARLGIVYGRDLAQACRDHFPKPLNYVLWIICEIAIAATDLAEVLGSAIGLYLLFGIPLLAGVLITTLDVLLLMGLISFGIRKMEAFILSLVATIGICFAFEMVLSKPSISEVATGLIPTPLSTEALFIALGIIGATVMPHNLYLHSALVQSRAVKRDREGIKEANKFNLIDSVVALNGAFFVNSAILILAASVFFKNDLKEVASIIDAHALLAPLLGSEIAPIAFGLALLAAGQSSTITGTFAGQIVMEGFIGLKMRPWLRRLITRVIAITPAVFVISVFGERSVDSLLVLSQVILSLQLPFALIPLLHFTSDKIKMGEFATKKIFRILAWISAAVIVGLNLKFIFDLIFENINSSDMMGTIVRYVLTPVTIVILPLLAYITLEPVISRRRKAAREKAPIETARLSLQSSNANVYNKIGIAIEGDREYDLRILNRSTPFLKMLNADIYLIHCVQSAATHFIGEMINDSEAKSKQEYLGMLAGILKKEGMKAHTIIGGGEPEAEIVRISKELNLQLIIAGSHGHQFINDLIYGSTVEGVRHKTRLPVLAIPVNNPGEE